MQKCKKKCVYPVSFKYFIDKDIIIRGTIKIYLKMKRYSVTAFPIKTNKKKNKNLVNGDGKLVQRKADCIVYKLNRQVGHMPT